VFTVSSAYGVPLEAALWPRLQADLRAALEGRLPLEDLLAAPSAPAEEDAAVSVSVDNAASEVFSVIDVRAEDRVGLLYRIARGLHDLGLDIHHARIATHAHLAQDVFYVWDLQGEKLNEPRASRAADDLAARLRGRSS
jgi:[protein-PII] uridylyltransferase